MNKKHRSRKNTDQQNYRLGKNAKNQTVRKSIKHKGLDLGEFDQ